MKFIIVINGDDFSTNTHNTVNLMRLVSDASKLDLDLVISISSSVEYDHRPYMYEKVTILDEDDMKLSIEEIISKYNNIDAKTKLLVLSTSNYTHIDPNVEWVFMDEYITTRVYTLIKEQMIEMNKNI